MSGDERRYPVIEPEQQHFTEESAQVYTLEEVASRLRVGRTHIFSLIKSGELSSLCIGRSRRISAAAFAKFIAARQQPALEMNEEEGS